MEAERDKDWG